MVAITMMSEAKPFQTMGPDGVIKGTSVLGAEFGEWRFEAQRE